MEGSRCLRCRSPRVVINTRTFSHPSLSMSWRMAGIALLRSPQGTMGHWEQPRTTTTIRVYTSCLCDLAKASGERSSPPVPQHNTDGPTRARKPKQGTINMMCVNMMSLFPLWVGGGFCTTSTKVTPVKLGQSLMTCFVFMKLLIFCSECANRDLNFRRRYASTHYILRVGGLEHAAMAFSAWASTSEACDPHIQACRADHGEVHDQKQFLKHE